MRKLPTLSKLGVLFIITLLFFEIPVYCSLHSVASSQNFDWSRLRGVNYHDPLLWTNDADARLGYPPAPPVSFPMIRQYGFNFIRVPIFWGMLSVNATGYLSELELVAKEADANGLAVLYSQFGTNCIFSNSAYFSRHELPPAIENQFSTMSSLFDAYYANNITDPLNGLLVWQDTVQNFWKPVIDAVDSYPSTIGYELANEPCAPNESSLANYHSYFAQQLRALTSKAIVYGSTGYDINPGTSNPPLDIGNLVQDVHSYDSSNPGTKLASWQSIGQRDGTQMLLGEFGTLKPNCETTRSCLDTIYQNYIQSAKNHGFAIAFWEWACSNNGNTALLDANCQPDWRVQDLSHYYNSILGPYTNQISINNTGTTISNSTNIDSINSNTSTSSATSSNLLLTSSWIDAAIIVVVAILGLTMVVRLRKVKTGRNRSTTRE